jgi:thiol-disulfide isomerase/thioredoxin
MRALDLRHRSTLTVVWIYAEWCGYCQRFIPVWEELVRTTPSVKFMAIDAEGDEFRKNGPPPGYPPVRGFPTIWIIPPSGPVVEYRQSRDLKSLQMAIDQSR